MDDKTLIASYVADEAQRINEKLKKMVSAGETPSDEERDAVIQDIETTLARLESALSNLAVHAEDEEDKHDPIIQ